MILQTRAQRNAHLLPLGAATGRPRITGSATRTRTFRVYESCRSNLTRPMATVAAPRRRTARTSTCARPSWLERCRRAHLVGGILLLLTALSAFLRTRYLSGQFWMDEALSVGISSHSLTRFPGCSATTARRRSTTCMLHVWMSVFGSRESGHARAVAALRAAHVPAGAWVAWSLFGARAALIAAVLFAFNPFLTAYSQETRMYTLMALLGCSPPPGSSTASSTAGAAT